MGPSQFSLRRLLATVTIIAVVVGTIIFIERARTEAHREAVRAAILDGRMSPEQGRWCLGDEVDVLKTKIAHGD
jgi:hypothetical protein